MCNLYSVKSNQRDLFERFKVQTDLTGNMPPGYAIFPDYPAPVVRIGQDGRRVLQMMRWGIPGPTQFGGKPVTNVRNVASPHWRPWLKKDYRCLVPATSFTEYTDSLPKVIHWFAIDASRPLFAFAGIWRPWTGIRGTKKDPIEGEHLLFSFLTTEPNEVVKPIHAKAMPVILEEHQWDIWLEGETADALALQRPYPAHRLQIVATGKRSDGEF